jgi:hypothetical protein
VADKDLDYILKLGLDVSRLKAADKEVRKTLEPSLKKLEQSERKRHVLQTKTVALKQKEISLAKRQVQIEKQIRAAEAKGAKGFTRIRRMSGEGSAGSIAEAELLLKRKLLAFETRYRKESAATKQEKQATLELQKRINKAEKAVKYYTPKKKIDPDSRISYQARTTLEEKLSRGFAKDYSTSITDPATLKRIEVAQSRLASLRKELADTKSFKTVARIRGDYAEVNREIAEAVRHQKALNREMQKGNQVGKKFASTAKSFALHFASAYAVIGAAGNIYRTGKELDSMRASLLAASGSAVAAEQDFKFLTDTSQELGKELTTLVGGYNKVAIAGRTAGFSAEQNKNIFMAASEAATAYGLSQDRTNLVMLAFSQMINKGKVSMEEIGLMSPSPVMVC